MTAVEFAESIQQVGAHGIGVLRQLFVLHDLDVAKGGRGSHRVPPEGDDMAEGGILAADEGVGDLFAGNGGAHRDVAAGDALGYGHDVGGYAPVLAGEHAPGAPEPGDDFVGDEEHAVAGAYIPQHGPVSIARHGDTGRAGDGLGDDRSHRLRAVELDEIFHGVGAADAALIWSLATELAAVGVGLWNVHRAGHQGLVVDARRRGHASQRHGPVGGAMI